VSQRICFPYHCSDAWGGADAHGSGGRDTVEYRAE
jgi:hypothetical protein